MELKSLTRIYSWKRGLILICVPILLLPIPIVLSSSEARCGYMLLLMAIYWAAEVLPLSVTALIPVVLAPLLKIIPAKKIAPEYMNSIVMLFIGGLMVATAVEYWNLHRRIALGVLMAIGSKPRWLLLGFMLSSWFLSMWISNTATTAMMLPIVDAVLYELRKYRISRQMNANNDLFIEEFGSGSASQNMCLDNDENNILKREKKSSCNNEINEDFELEFKNLCKCLSLCICYSASCGGMATLTGTGPNLALAGFVDELFGSAAGINFGTWMIFALPVSLICLLLCWLWLLIYFLGPRQIFQCGKTTVENEEGIRCILKNEYKKLGPIRFAEWMCIFALGGVVLLWVSRNPGVPGWSRLFTDVIPATNKTKTNTINWTDDSTPAIFISIILFMLPSRNPFKSKTSGSIDPENAPVTIATHKNHDKSPNLLIWPIIQSKFPWNIVLLIGGGLALAKTCSESGLSVWIGKNLQILQHLSPIALILIISFGTSLLTEFTSNTAMATILLPISASLAQCLKLHPLMLMLPAAISCSFAFCLPVATPPNAIVFAKGHLTVVDMIKCGFFMNIMAVLVVTTATLSYASIMFDFSTFPNWAKGGCLNKTTI